MFRFAAIPLALSLFSNAAYAQTAAKAPDVAAPSDFGCSVRMMFLIDAAQVVIADKATTLETRSKAEKFVTNSRRVLYYYLGRISLESSATNRSAETRKELDSIRSLPSETFRTEVALCMTNAEKAEGNLLAAMTSPAKN